MKKNIWILLDNRIGSRHQAEGIAAYLDEASFNITFKTLEYTRLAGLPNFIRGKSLLGLSEESKKSLTEPFPDIVLSSTRRTAPIARYIKKHSPNTKLVQLIHIGRTGLKDFSLIFTPEHDKNKVTAPNIRYTVGCPHFITPQKLAEAQQHWQQKFSALPHPITAAIIGGSIKKRPFSLENAKNLALAIKALKQKEGGSLLITTSRRTGAQAEALIMSILKEIPHSAYLWGSKEENPYLGYLACADDLIVTGDSVSMCCEATATNKKLRIFTGSGWLTPKHERFVQSLYNNNYAVDLNKPEVTAAPSAPILLNTAKLIADEITKL